MKGTLLTLACVLLFVDTEAAAPFATDRVNNKIVEAVCLRQEDGSVFMAMAASFGGNYVDRVIALPGEYFERYDDGSTNEVLCGYTGDIRTDDGIRMNSTVGQNGVGVNECGASPIYQEGTTILIGFVWHVQIRENYTAQIFTNIDRTYRIQCLYSDIGSTVVTASVQVFQPGPNTGVSIEVRPVNRMFIVSGLTRIPLGHLVQLGVETRQESPRQSEIHPYGSYIFTCDYRYSIFGQRIQYIDEFGCPLTGNIFDFVNGFRFARYENRDGRRWYQTETQNFRMARVLPPEDTIYFSCYLNYCFEGEGSDTRCTDFCAHNQAAGRKKRSVQAEADHVTLAVRLYDPNDSEIDAANDKNTSTDDSLSSTMIAIVAAVAVVLVITVLFATCAICYVFRGRKRGENERSSTSGSTKNLPSHLQQDHIRSYKI